MTCIEHPLEGSLRRNGVWKGMSSKFEKSHIKYWLTWSHSLKKPSGRKSQSIPRVLSSTVRAYCEQTSVQGFRYCIHSGKDKRVCTNGISKFVHNNVVSYVLYLRVTTRSCAKSPWTSFLDRHCYCIFLCCDMASLASDRGLDSESNRDKMCEVS